MPMRRPLLTLKPDSDARTYIAGKDLPLEQTIADMSGVLARLGIKIEIASWRNIVPNVWSLHIRDAHSPMCFTNGKGATKESALASALGEYIERISNNHFYAGAFGAKTSPTRRLSITRTSAGSSLAVKMRCRRKSSMSTAGIYNPDGELRGSHLVDTNSGNVERGIFRCRMCGIRTARWCISRPT
jgi:ribosomal protein S12 methylthiotransferase accessory factor